MSSIIDKIGDGNPLSELYRAAASISVRTSNQLHSIAMNARTLSQIKASKITVSHNANDMLKQRLHEMLLGIQVNIDNSLADGEIEFKGNFDPEFIESIKGGAA